MAKRIRNSSRAVRRAPQGGILAGIMGGKESASAKESRARQLRWRTQYPDRWKRMRAAQKRRYYRQFQIRGPRRCRPWTTAEDARITAERRPTDRKLSKILGRSVQAIQQRRSGLRK